MWYTVEISKTSSRRGRKLRENRTENDKVISEWTLHWAILSNFEQNLRWAKFALSYLRWAIESAAEWKRRAAAIRVLKMLGLEGCARELFATETFEKIHDDRRELVQFVS